MADVLDFPCSAKYLPSDLWVSAAQTAVQENPCNRPSMNAPAGAMATIHDPQHLAVLTTKFWGAKGVNLTVAFMEQTPNDLANRIVAHMNAWGDHANVKFTRSATDPQVRITRALAGYWSYLGIDILHVPRTEATFCLEGFTMSTPEAEFRRVVRHETGHTLGCPHEHMRTDIIRRIDAEKAFKYFKDTQGWTRTMVQQNVLTPLAENSLMNAPDADETSIMAYNLPAIITKDGRPIAGGSDIGPQDIVYIGSIYPKQNTSPPPPGPPASKATAEVAIHADKKKIYIRAEAGWSVEKMPPTAGDRVMPEVLTPEQCTALADEADQLLNNTTVPGDAQAAPGVFGVIGAVRSFVTALRSGDFNEIRRTLLALLTLLLGDGDDGISFQQRQAALGQRLNWAKLLELLMKVLPMVIGA